MLVILFQDSTASFSAAYCDSTVCKKKSLENGDTRQKKESQPQTLC